MDRRTLAARVRRRAFVPLVAATAVLCLAWGMVDPTNCAPGSHGGDYCLLFGHQRELVLTLAAGPVVALALAVAVAVPSSWAGRLPAVAFLQRAPRSLPLVVVVTAAYAPWLFWGELVASPWLWLLLAVPFAPFLGVFAGLSLFLWDAPSPGVPVLVLLLFLFAITQAMWYYGLAHGVDRAVGHVRRVLTSHRNSWWV